MQFNDNLYYKSKINDFITKYIIRPGTPQGCPGV